jgi:hypothetical protein
MNHNELIEDIKEINDKFTIIQGVFDIIKRKDTNDYIVSSIENSYWVLIGKGSEEMINESFEDYQFDVEREGEYFIESVLRYYKPEYEEGRCIMRDYLDVEYINLTFQQSFEEREREFKLNEILDKEFDQLFNTK